MFYVPALGPTERPAAVAAALPPDVLANRSQEFAEERKKRVRADSSLNSASCIVFQRLPGSAVT